MADIASLTTPYGTVVTHRWVITVVCLALLSLSIQIQINYPGSGNSSQFTYDAMGMNVKIIEQSGSTTTSTKQFVWCGEKICEARDASATSINQYYTHGQTTSGTKYFYTGDHLGSITGVSDDSGILQAAYSYNSYGQAITIMAGVTSDFQYAGYYFHSPSGLNIAVHRLYSSNLGRWLNRDLLEETADVNLFAYCHNRPINTRDPLGLEDYSGGLVTLIPLIPGMGELGNAALGGLGALAGLSGLGGLGGLGPLMPLIPPPSGNGPPVPDKGVPKKRDPCVKKQRTPDWAIPYPPYTGETPSEYAKRLLDWFYGVGNWKEGPGTPFNEIKKSGSRGYIDPN